eukprot:scaffold91807_cov19-Tisochrysis_lutea.AAC.2
MAVSRCFLARQCGAVIRPPSSGAGMLKAALGQKRGTMCTLAVTLPSLLRSPGCRMARLHCLGDS